MVNHGRWALGVGSQQECNINCTFYIYIASVFIHRYILHIFIALMFKQSGVHLFVDLLMYIEIYVVLLIILYIFIFDFYISIYIYLLRGGFAFVFQENEESGYRKIELTESRKDYPPSGLGRLIHIRWAPSLSL